MSAPVITGLVVFTLILIATYITQRLNHVQSEINKVAKQMLAEIGESMLWCPIELYDPDYDDFEVVVWFRWVKDSHVYEDWATATHDETYDHKLKVNGFTKEQHEYIHLNYYLGVQDPSYAITRGKVLNLFESWKIATDG